MNKIIPLVGGAVNAHQQFEIQLGDVLALIKLDWRTLTEMWSMRIDVEGINLVNGAILQPNADVIAVWNLTPTLGNLVFTGEAVTLDNLGSANQLTWVPPGE